MEMDRSSVGLAASFIGGHDHTVIARLGHQQRLFLIASVPDMGIGGRSGIQQPFRTATEHTVRPDVHHRCFKHRDRYGKTIVAAVVV